MKVRVLTFDLGSEVSRQNFRMLYEGFLGGAAQIEKRNLIVVRSESRVLDKLDPISVPRTDYAAFRELRDRPGEEVELEFEAEDFNLIIKYIETAQWGPVGQRSVRDFDDWLRASPTVDKE